MDYPKQVLQDIYWAYREPTFDTIEDFVTEIKHYYKTITNTKLAIDLDEILFNFPKVRIQYVKYNDGDVDEPQVDLEADNGTSFSAKELLYKLHNEVGVNLFEDDNCYFEGLTFADIDDDDIPVYFLDTGS